MPTKPIYEGQNFFVPRYEITLEGQDVPAGVLRDVKEITYTDSLSELDFFEFVLHDWDPVHKQPMYSSPYDESGQQRTLPDGGARVPLFDPGAELTLRLGYYGAEDATVMLKGRIVTITPSFPANGQPGLRLRALNPLHTLQRKQESMNFENKTDSEIAQEIARSLDVDIEIPAGQAQDETRYEFMSFSNEYPINFLLGRAIRLGYDLHVEPPEDPAGKPTLFFGKKPEDTTIYELEWGRSLVSFMPSVKTKGQITRVVVRGWRPGGRGDDRRIVGTATFHDAGLQLPDTKLVQAIDSALREFEEQVVEDPIESQTEADAKAKGLLTKKLQDLITATGSTVGTPRLRAGKTIAVKGVGTRYSGTYILTETTHKVTMTGYTTEFKARMEGGPPR
jgi:phage protein D